MTGETVDAAPEEVYAVGARIAYPWDPTEEIPLQKFANPYERRLHPFCALLRNTPLFRRVAEHIGFSCVRYLWAERDQYLDTCELLTVVMRTFGYRYLRSSATVGHFFEVSYNMTGEAHHRHHAAYRDVLLEALRTGRPVNTPAEGSRSP